MPPRFVDHGDFAEVLLADLDLGFEIVDLARLLENYNWGRDHRTNAVVGGDNDVDILLVEAAFPTGLIHTASSTDRSNTQALDLVVTVVVQVVVIH